MNTQTIKPAKEITFTPEQGKRIDEVLTKCFGPLLGGLSAHVSIGGGKTAALNYAHALGARAVIMAELGFKVPEDMRLTRFLLKMGIEG